MWCWAFLVSSCKLTNSFPGEERVRELRDDVIVWARWKSDFEMEISVQGVFGGVTVVEGKGRRQDCAEGKD